MFGSTAGAERDRSAASAAAMDGSAARFEFAASTNGTASSSFETPTELQRIFNIQALIDTNVGQLTVFRLCRPHRSSAQVACNAGDP